MDFLLKEKNLYGKITIAPTTTSTNGTWTFDENESKAQNVIVKHIVESHFEYVSDKASVHAMWKCLIDTFERKSVTSKIILKKMINSA